MSGCRDVPADHAPHLDLPASVAPFEMVFASEAVRVAEVRHELRQWLHSAGIGPDQAYDVLLAVDEACANAVEHGYRDGPGPVRLSGEIAGDRLHLSIVDRGSWEPHTDAPDPVRGRGLSIIRALISEVEISTGADGTRVELRTGIVPAQGDLRS